MINSLSKKLTAWKRSRKIGYLVVLTLIFCSLICVFLVLSTTTTGLWDGAFPPGEYHLKIENELGDPIEGASLSIFDGGTKNFAFEYPIDNFLSAGNLISNEQGIIIALHRPRGFEFGGSCLYILWIIPMCSGSPEFNGQISAEGYRTIKFSLQELFDLAYNESSIGTSFVLLENGEIAEMPIYEKTFTLKK